MMRPYTLSMLLFAGFAALAVVAALTRRKAAVQIFVLYTVAAGLYAGFLHREAWPFSRWQVFAYRYVRPSTALEIRGVDARGAEYQIDRRAWEPIPSLELHTWIRLKLEELDAQTREAAGRYLLEMANAARSRAAAGGKVGRFDRYFGALASPEHVIHRKIWSEPGGLPPEPFAGLRIYLDEWDPEERRRDPRRFKRVLLYEFPPR
ncbi:MAG: hypothetical protein HYR60_18685 [Acidobacteria bacterium]|nr:hypothetical protein [Acidobacteriota bacterium]